METETTDTDAAHIDSTVFENAPAIVDEWFNGHGIRFYRLLDEIGENPSVYAKTTYEKKIDPDTGETVETEKVKAIGAITTDLYFKNATKQLATYLEGEGWLPEHIEPEVIVEELFHEFTPYIESRLLELFEDTNPENIELYLNKYVQFPMNWSTEINQLWESRRNTFTEAEWESFFYALMDATDLIRRADDNTSGDYEHVYAFIPQFEAVPEWRLRAAENYWCGVFQNVPALANIEALRHSEEYTTQAEMAETLDRHKSTISQQVKEVESLRDRTDWMSKNRL